MGKRSRASAAVRSDDFVVREWDGRSDLTWQVSDCDEEAINGDAPKRRRTESSTSKSPTKARGKGSRMIGKLKWLIDAPMDVLLVRPCPDLPR